MVRVGFLRPILAFKSTIDEIAILLMDTEEMKTRRVKMYRAKIGKG